MSVVLGVRQSYATHGAKEGGGCRAQRVRALGSNQEHPIADLGGIKSGKHREAYETHRYTKGLWLY